MSGSVSSFSRSRSVLPLVPPSANTFETSRACTSAGDDRAPFHVHRDVPLPSPDLLARIGPRGPAAFRRLHRWTVDDRPRRVHTTACLRPCQGPVIAPGAEMNGGRQGGLRRHGHPDDNMDRIPSRVRRPSDPGPGPAGRSAPPPHQSDRLADHQAPGDTAPGWPRSKPRYHPSSVSKRPAEYYSARPPQTSGTDTQRLQRLRHKELARPHRPSGCGRYLI